MLCHNAAHMAIELASPATTGELDEYQSFDAYQAWQRKEGVPLLDGFYIEDLNTVELGAWARKGVRGAMINLEGTGGVNDTHVVELGPGGMSNPEHHMYEEMVYALSGQGSTSVWYEGRNKQTFEWGAGSLFAIPINAWYQHFNGSGNRSARLLSVTNLPTIMRTFHSEDFVFGDPFAFKDRFTGEAGYFAGEGKLFRSKNQKVLETNFVPDVRSLALHTWKQRGGGGSNVMIELAQNSMGAHVSQFQTGMYKKAHRHGPGAHVIILNGVGFSLLWDQPGAEPKRCDWKPGSVVVPPENWLHQHFNSGVEPVRYLALRLTGRRFFQPGKYRSGSGPDVSIKLGGWQVEYEDEDPAVHRLFEEELAAHGATCFMKGYIPWCTGQASDVQLDQSGD